MRVLVTGGNGHLGHTLVGALLARGHTVHATLRSLANAEQVSRMRALRDVTLHEGDIRDAAKMRAALEGIDVLFNTATVYSPTDAAREQEMLASAIAGTETVLRAAAAQGVKRVVMTSSTVTLPLTLLGAPPSTEDD